MMNSKASKELRNWISHYVCFTDYDETIQNKQVAFHKVLLKNTFGEYLAAHDMTQVRIAETEKYAHVTFFFNGGVEEPNKGEDRISLNLRRLQLMTFSRR